MARPQHDTQFSGQGGVPGPVQDTGDYFTSGEHALVEALEGFVLPLIKRSTARYAKEHINLDRSGEISFEAQELLHTLTTYVESIISRIPEAQDEGNTIIIDEDHPVNYDPVEISLPQGLDDDELYLQYVQSYSPEDDEDVFEFRVIAPLEEERDIVFNKMPIRLLMFNSDGSEIKLFDRHELYHHIEASPITSIYTSYAILSHTWSQSAYGEVTYNDWHGNAVRKDSPGYSKLATFCRTVATRYGIRLAWMDTVCINKESSTELGESIRSMYKWYQSAAVCLVYLADTASSEDMAHDRWFTRGWTLQELIAPRRIHFFNKEWKKMVGRYSDVMQTDTICTDLAPAISEASSILEDELKSCCLQSPTVVPIWRRMQWAAARNVTREEDTAYSLMGIFDVSISTAYGEGKERAFYRLVREILNTNTPRALELINWGCGNDLGKPSITPRPPSALIPSSPKRYMWSAKNIQWPIPSVPLTLSHLGLCVRMLLMPAFEVTRETYQQRQKSSDSEHLPYPGNYHASVGPVLIRPTVYTFDDSEYMERYFDILHRRNLPRRMSSTNEPVSVLAIFNFEEKTNTVALPEGPCFALLDWRPQGLVLESGKISDEYRFSVTTVKDVIALGMKTQNGASLIIHKSNLATHGMSLHTDYV